MVEILELLIKFLEYVKQNYKSSRYVEKYKMNNVYFDLYLDPRYHWVKAQDVHTLKSLIYFSVVDIVTLTLATLIKVFYELIFGEIAACIIGVLFGLSLFCMFNKKVIFRLRAYYQGISHNLTRESTMTISRWFRGYKIAFIDIISINLFWLFIIYAVFYLKYDLVLCVLSIYLGYCVTKCLILSHLKEKYSFALQLPKSTEVVITLTNEETESFCFLEKYAELSINIRGDITWCRKEDDELVLRGYEDILFIVFKGTNYIMRYENKAWHIYENDCKIHTINIPYSNLPREDKLRKAGSR